MAIKGEIYPVAVAITPNSNFGINAENCEIDINESDIQIYNDRGINITTASDKSQLFADNTNLIIGYNWNTQEVVDNRFTIESYYTFKFIIAIKFQTAAGESQISKLLFSTMKVLEADTTAIIS